MISKSTEIVRGRVTATAPAARGSVLYTTAKIEVLERFKGAESASVDVWVPGAAALQYLPSRGALPGESPDSL